MAHVVTKMPEPFLACEGAVRVHPVPAARDNIVWIVESLETPTVVVIDGTDSDEAIEACAARGLTLTEVWNTHTHGDHIGINRALKRHGMLDALHVVGPGSRASEVPGITRGVTEGDLVPFANRSARVMLTEGHIDGHVSYVLGDLLFCGDALFTGGCGYLFDGPPSKMFDALLRFAQLPGETRVCCAHEYTEDNLRFAWSVEPDNEALARRIRAVWSVRAEGGCTVPSTIEIERATNPFLRPGSPSLQRSVLAADPTADGSTWLGVFTATRRLKDGGAHKALPDSSLPLADAPGDG